MKTKYGVVAETEQVKNSIMVTIITRDYELHSSVCSDHVIIVIPILVLQTYYRIRELSLTQYVYSTHKSTTTLKRFVYNYRAIIEQIGRFKGILIYSFIIIFLA